MLRRLAFGWALTIIATASSMNHALKQKCPGRQKSGRCQKSVIKDKTTAILNQSCKNQQQFHLKTVGKTPMKTFKNRLDKSYPKGFRHCWSCLRIRKRITQPLEKPFGTPFSGSPVITYRKGENCIPTYLSTHHLLSPQAPGWLSCTGVNYRATQTQPKKTHPQDMCHL